MPKLTIYTAPGADVSTSFVPASPDSMGAAVGQGARTAGQSLIHLNDRIGEDESRQAIVGAAQIRTKYAALLDQATLSGEDTANLKSKMNDELAAVGENFTTTKGQDSLDLHTATTNLVFDEQANRMAVTKAAAQARLQATTLLASESATLRSNPAYLSVSEKNVDALISTFNLPPDKRAEIAQEMKGELNMAAVMSSARIDPEGTKKKLNDGEWMLTPKQREQGVNEAETQMRAIRSDEIHKRQLADYDLRKADAAAADDIVKKILGGSLASGEIRLNPALTAASKENLSRFQAWYLADNANKPHPGNLMQLWLAIHAPNDDPRKVYNGDPVFRMAESGGLNPGEAEKALTWVAQQKDENNVSLMAKLQGRMMTIKAGMTADPQWAAQGELSSAVQMELVNRATARMNELRRTGEKGQDPSQVLNPDSKEYLFTPGILTTVANDIRSQNRAMTYPKFTNPNDPALAALEPGSHFYDVNGVERIVPKPKGATPAAQHATSLDIQAGYIELVPRSGGQFTINAPNRSSAHVLNGKRYPSREAALEALKGL